MVDNGKKFTHSKLMRTLFRLSDHYDEALERTRSPFPSGTSECSAAVENDDITMIYVSQARE
jgi:hypothetical protein